MEDIKEKYKNRAFTAEQWYQLELGYKNGIDVDEFANPKFSVEQMEILREAKEKGLDIKVVCSPSMSPEEMTRVLDHICEESGFYDEQYEATRRKWLKNITWSFVLITSFIFIASILYINRDTVLLYFQDLDLTLKEQVVTLSTNEEFTPESYIDSFTDSADLTIENDVDTSQPSTYQVRYSITNGKKKVSKLLIVNVLDTISPSIQLKTDKVELKKGNSFVCRNYIQEVSDNVDELSIEEVSCSDEIDWNKSEQYISYSIQDAAGNETEQLLLVVIPKEVNIPNNQQNSNHQTTPENQTPQTPNNQMQPSTLPIKRFMFVDGYMMPDPSNPNDPKDAFNCCLAYKGNYSGGCYPLTDGNGIYIGYEYRP